MRPIKIGDHPVAKKRYRIPTPAIEQFYALVQRCIQLSIPGAIVYARTRFGKSSAIVYSQWLLAEEYPSLPVFRVRIAHKRVASEIAFFSAFLTAAHHRAMSGQNPTKLRHRLKQRLLEIADGSQSSAMLMFLDEAQHLGATEFEWLRDIHDELDDEGINLMLIFVGQPSLQAKKSLFQRERAKVWEIAVNRTILTELHLSGEQHEVNH